MPSGLLSEGPRRLQGGSTTQFCVSTFLTLDKAAASTPSGPLSGAGSTAYKAYSPRAESKLPGHRKTPALNLAIRPFVWASEHSRDGQWK